MKNIIQKNAFDRWILKATKKFSYKKVVKHLEYFHGIDNIPFDGPFIIVPNHQSYFDNYVISVLLDAFRDRLPKLPTKRIAFNTKLRSRWMNASGAVPIDPEDPNRSYQTLKDLLSDGEIIVMFPEGRRSDGINMLPFKHGAFNLSVDMNIPILPVGIVGSENVLPKDSHQFQEGKNASIFFGELIDPQDFDSQDKQLQADNMLNFTREVIEELKKTNVGSFEADILKNDQKNQLIKIVDNNVERLLHSGKEKVESQHTRHVIDCISLVKKVVSDHDTLNIQYSRAYGAWLESISIFKALFKIPKYRALLEGNLEKTPENSIANATLGLFHLVTPRLLGGNNKQALKLIQKAYDNSAYCELPAEKYASYLAWALEKNGYIDTAKHMLKTHFDNDKLLTDFKSRDRRIKGQQSLDRLNILHPKKNHFNRQSENLNHSRKVSGLELAMVHYEIADLIAGEVEGNIQFDAFRKAAQALHKRHPSLRTKVTWINTEDDHPIFEVQPIDLSKVITNHHQQDDNTFEISNISKNNKNILPSVEKDEREYWQKIIEEECEFRFDVLSGYMFRATLVTTKDKRNFVIINVNHAFVDGISLMRLLHETLTLVSHFQAPLSQDIPLGTALPPHQLEEQLPPAPSALSQIKTTFIERFLGKLFTKELIKEHKHYQEKTPFAIEEQLFNVRDLKSQCHFVNGTNTNWKKIRKACKVNGVTIGAAFSAAVQIASLKQIISEGGSIPRTSNKIHFPMSMFFSTRRFIENADVCQEQLGLYTGVSDIGVKVNDDIEFWELAQALFDSSRKQIKQRSPIIFQLLIDNLKNVGQYLFKNNVEYRQTGGVGDGVAISNVGQYPYESNYQDLYLKNIYGLSGSVPGGATFYFWIRSLNDRFCYNAVSTGPAANRERGELMFQNVVNIMEQCAENKSMRLLDTTQEYQRLEQPSFPMAAKVAIK